ncbi:MULTISPECIES: c-type cytochrome [unclassified Marinovum]
MNYVKFTGLALGLSVGIAIAGGVAAHSGAKGIVKDRMDGMMALGKSVKAITPMMRGKVAYDADAVKGFAQDLRTHSGEAMTRLFPEGTNAAPSVAKARIWTDWDGFEALAMQLHALSDGMEQAADNGLKGTGGTTGNMMGGATMGANMMGGSAMGGATMGGDAMGSGAMMGGAAAASLPSPDALAEMPADAVFRLVSQTCASCHTKFRAEK